MNTFVAPNHFLLASGPPLPCLTLGRKMFLTKNKICILGTEADHGVET